MLAGQATRARMMRTPLLLHSLLCPFLCGVKLKVKNTPDHTYSRARSWRENPCHRRRQVSIYLLIERATGPPIWLVANAPRRRIGARLRWPLLVLATPKPEPSVLEISLLAYSPPRFVLLRLYV